MTQFPASISQARTHARADCEPAPVVQNLHISVDPSREKAERSPPGRLLSAK